MLWAINVEVAAALHTVAPVRLLTVSYLASSLDRTITLRKEMRLMSDTYHVNIAPTTLRQQLREAMMLSLANPWPANMPLPTFQDSVDRLEALCNEIAREAAQGASATPSEPKQPVASKSLTEVMASLELPWPKDIFGEVPEDEWHEIDEFAKTRGYRIDSISGDLMRRGWKVHERLLRERVNDLVEDGFVVSTDVSNPQEEALTLQDKEENTDE